MHIEKLIDRKAQLEEDLRLVIYEQVQKFRSDTGYTPDNISVYLRDVTGLGESIRVNMVNEVSVSLDLNGVVL